MRELCRLHNVPLPNELDSLLLPPQPEMVRDFHIQQKAAIEQQQAAIDDSDADEIEDAIGESEPESEADEDLSLEMDDGRSASKVSIVHKKICEKYQKICSRSLKNVFSTCRKMKWKWNT